jgi:uncharacterized protein YdhG (YjbR/CyaY superfamily)
MAKELNSVKDYVASLPEERKAAIEKLREVINANIKGPHEETISYNMLGWVVPKSDYPAGYHCDPKLPLPFINLASQKSYIALYHMGIYADQDLLEWFQKEYPKHAKYKLDMGKSCIRFKRVNGIPFQLIGELISRMDTHRWIEIYEKNIKR